jgi:ribosomal protein S18 acetylase RimI-like enzyme
MQIRPFMPADTDAVISLWADAGLIRPWNDPRKDIERKLSVQPELFLVAEDAGRVVGVAMVGYDGHRGWVNYLAVAQESRGLAYGRALMEEAERLLIELGCPKINLQIRADNTQVRAFYEHLGYAQDAAVSYGKRLIPD